MHGRKQQCDNIMFENEVMNSAIGGNFKLTPAGNHLCRIYGIVSLGTADHEFTPEGGKPVISHYKKIRLGFELLGQEHIFDPERGPEPFVIWIEERDSMNKKSNLRKILKSWLAKEMTEEEAAKFNWVSLLGKEPGGGARAMVNVIHKKTSKGNEVSEVAGITPAPTPVAGQPPIPLGKIKPVLFNFNPPFKADVFKTLPEWIQKEIRRSDEYIKLVGADTTTTPANGATTQQTAGSIEAPATDDLPF
jgi:hypothetical protein